MTGRGVEWGCRCETILSPQMEHVPGVHHDADCPLRRGFVLTSAVQRHQVRKYLSVLGVEWVEDDSLPGDSSAFFVPDATDAEWDHVQAWVKQVTE